MRHDVDYLISKSFAKKLAAGIDREKRDTELALPDLPHSDTVYVTVVDRDRRCCSLINSLFHGFGSAICTPNTGIMLQNRGACFNVTPGHVNCIDGGKRPMHTLIPGLAMQNGKPVMSFGVMGGAYQAVGHAHFVSNMVNYSMDVQEAIDAPRMFWDMTTGVLQAERTISSSVLSELSAKGHDVQTAATAIGGGQAIWIDWDRGVLIGGSDPRKDGCALGF